MKDSGSTFKPQEDLDPVCGMAVTSESEFHFHHSGTDYYFCSEYCEKKFSADPSTYLASGPSSSGAGDALATDAIYTCPMHPDIRQNHPGSCPKCGMALEPLTVEIDEDTSELDDMARRFWVSVALALPVFLLAMVADLVPSLLPEGLSMKTVQWIEFTLATTVVLWGGWPFFVRGWQSVMTRNSNMFTLISLGVGVAWGYSIVALLIPALFPANMLCDSGTVPVYFEAAAVITTLVLLGQVLELRARGQTNMAIKLLLGLAPNTARILTPDS